MRLTKRHVIAAGLVAVAGAWLLIRAEAAPAGGASPPRGGPAGSARAEGLAKRGGRGWAAGPDGSSSLAAAGAVAAAAPARGEVPGVPGTGPRPWDARGPGAPLEAASVDVHWVLEQAAVVSPGTTVAIAADPKTGQPGGLFTDGYVLEGKVRAKPGGPIPDGDLRVTLTAFRPDADQPGQKAGLWHVQGKWKVVARDADPEALRARHNPYVVEGRIQDALRVNPAEASGGWSLRASVPTSPAAGRWARSRRGTLTLRPGGGGDLEIALALLGGNP